MVENSRERDDILLRIKVDGLNDYNRASVETFVTYCIFYASKYGDQDPFYLEMRTKAKNLIVKGGERIAKLREDLRRPMKK